MNVAIIVAAGQGLRVGGIRPKQFVELAGAPVLIHTLKRFEHCAAIQEVVLVLPSQDATEFLPLTDVFGFKKITRTVEGGATRSESVLRGLESLKGVDVDIVAIHDGVRPFVTADEIERTMRAAETTGASVLTAHAVDTIKEIENGRVVRTLERANLRRALTPQCFRFDIIVQAYGQSPQIVAAATDDSSLVESLGVPVTVVEGNSRNIKITGPEDLALAEIILSQDSEFRTQDSE